MLHRVLTSLILLPDPYCYQVPDDLGLVAEAVVVPNAHGQLLHGFLFQPSLPLHSLDASRPAEAPVVLFCPGTSGNLSSHLYYVELLCRAGCTVLSVDYSGFGRSQGQATLPTLATDVLCACDFVRQTMQVERFGVFGVSIGANLALLAASQRRDVGAVAVEGLALYAEITRGLLTDGIMGPRVITRLLAETRQLPPRTPHVLNAWHVPPRLAQALARVGTRLFPFPGKDPCMPARLLTDTPTLFIHGMDDPLLPFEGTLQAYQATPGPKRLWLIPEVSHAQEPVLVQDAEYVAQLQAFFHAALPTPHHVWPDPQASLAWEVEAESAQTCRVHLHNSGPAGLILVTVVVAQTLAYHTCWVDGRRTLEGIPTDAAPMVSCLRLSEVEGTGDLARPRLTTRGQRYRTELQPLVRQLSRVLHERHFYELEPLVRALPSTRPEAPFDFFLGLYCVEIMKRTQRKLPHIARAAAQAFQQYWHYGPPNAPAQQPTPWHLVAQALD